MGYNAAKTTKAILESFRFLNKQYNEYIKFSILENKIKLLNTLELIELIADKDLILLVISNRHNDIFFENVFSNYKDLENFIGITNIDYNRQFIKDCSTKNGIYTSYGYISKIKLKDFSDRWFLKIKY